jgi:hypothetical protein
MNVTIGKLREVLLTTFSGDFIDEEELEERIDDVVAELEDEDEDEEEEIG